MSTINLSKRKHRLVKSTSGERYPTGKSLQKQSGAVPLGCHAEINKSVLIGQVRDTARYPAGITPSVNGPLHGKDSSWCIAKVACQSRWPFTQWSGRGYYCILLLFSTSRYRDIKGFGQCFENENILGIEYIRYIGRL